MISGGPLDNLLARASPTKGNNFPFFQELAQSTPSKQQSNLPLLPKSPLSSPTWSSYPSCSNPKDAITLCNIDRYLSGTLPTTPHSFHSSRTASSPSMQSPDSLTMVTSMSTPGSSTSGDASSIWDHCFSPIDLPREHHTHRSPSPSDSDTSGVSSGSSTEPLAEGLSEMIVSSYICDPTRANEALWGRYQTDILNSTYCLIYKKHFDINMIFISHSYQKLQII